jgi:chemotaxis protein methyltransferase CheR
MHNTELNSIYSAPVELSLKELSEISSFAYKSCGIVLGEHKKNLVISRLQPLLRKYVYHSYHEFYEKNLCKGTANTITEFISAITTNHTYFYREKEHFEFYLQHVLPELEVLKDNKDLRVWCAASSSGEEPYFLEMLHHEYFGSKYRLWNAGILATDISEKALNKAAKGVYSQESIKNIPSAMQQKYFQILDSDPGNVQVIRSIKEKVLYRKLNLLHPFPFKERMDIIFCRNVLIYFDDQTKREILSKLSRTLAMHGYLFLGHSESISQLSKEFKLVRPGVFKVGGYYE